MAATEIPLQSEKPKIYRALEIMPGFISWNILIAPIWISLINPTVAATLIIAYVLMWFVKSVAMNVRVVQGYKLMHAQQKIDWAKLCREIDAPAKTLQSGKELIY